MYLYPVIYHAQSQEPQAHYLKLTPYVLYKCSFPHSDIVVTNCKHLYHLWCAAIHFRSQSTCIEGICGARVSHEWFMNFGFGEFDQEMIEQALAEDCKEARFQLLNLQSQTTRVHCSNVGIFFLISYSLICPVIKYVCCVSHFNLSFLQ